MLVASMLALTLEYRNTPSKRFSWSVLYRRITSRIDAASASEESEVTLGLYLKKYIVDL